jgi:hypothetical protein
MPDFSRIISLAYMRILQRLPDPGGLASYNQLMNSGLSEALMRESLLRSPEYAQGNPLSPAATTRAARATAAKAARRRTKGRTRKSARAKRA